jgi:hypothetical protein
MAPAIRSERVLLVAFQPYAIDAIGITNIEIDHAQKGNAVFVTRWDEP